MYKVAVILSGCGVFDGSEIHEATLTLLALAKNKVDYQVFAPNVEQHHVINHLTQSESKETRNVLVESARIARGNIQDLSDFDVNNYDALVLPGGFGAAKNLSSFAFEGANMSINQQVALSISAMYKAKKPIGAMCISPVLLAKAIGNEVKLTVGSQSETATIIEELGATHSVTNHGEVVVDEEQKIVTTPCYMLDANIVDIEEGTANLVKELIKLM